MDSDQHGIPRAESDFESGLNDDDRLDLRIWLRLLTCANMIERRVRQNLRMNFDTTLPRFDVLAQIDRSPEGQPMRELSHRPNGHQWQHYASSGSVGGGRPSDT